MDEQRTQQYLNLINQLLTCNEGDETRILQENQELLDQGLLEVMIAVAQQFEEAGRENEAQFLISIAQQLAQELGLLDNPTTESANTAQDYVNFLRETLQKVAENPNPKVIYPFLQQNIDKLDDNLIKVLEYCAKNKFLSVKKEAYDILNFSNLIAEFPLGKIDINLEIAIIGYQTVLTIFTFEAFPQEWATIQINLAATYFERIKGEKLENLEQAIFHCREALKVYTFDKFPKKWAAAQINFGATYSESLKQGKAQDFEQAIFHYREALKVYTFDKFPKKWAMIQINLAATYSKSFRREKTEDLEQAIFHCREALKVYTFDTYPQKWAMTQNNLGEAYSHRIKEDKAENLEQAIFHCREALKVYTFDTYPQKWAMIQNNLGEAYRKRIKGNEVENLKQAIFHYREALRVYKFDTYPADWAMTQNNFGLAYSQRIKGNEVENLKQAIFHYREALRVYKFDTYPGDWAMTQNNLGNAYLYTKRNYKAENLEQAIFHYHQALKVYTFDEFPSDWAMIQNNLGLAYSKRIRDDKADKTENLKQAIASYHNALIIDTKEDNPVNCLQTARNLANLHYEQKQWQSATEAYHTAIEAVENARLEALNPQSRQEVLSNAIDVFHGIVQAYINLNQPEKALEYIERSKGRNLVEFMTQKALKPQNVSQEIIDKLAELKQQVVNEQIRLQNQSINQNLMRNDNLTPYVQDQSYLKQYQQELDNFIKKEITPHDENFQLTQKVKPIPFEDIKALTDDSTCLLQLYMTGDKILAFIVSADGRVNYWESSKINQQSLDYVINNYVTLYNKYRNHEHDQWKDKLNNFLETIARIIHINQIIAVIPNTCQRLIIVPHWFLHILPLHALPLEKNYILQDKYDIQYAPSCQLLQITKQRPLNQLTNVFAIQNPTKDLIFTDLEVNIISNLFNQKEVIAKDKATESTVTRQIKASESHCYHFSCHGNFNPDNPLESTLLLAKPDKLTLGEIFELNLKKSRLVVLSACETGLIDLTSISDEYIGLPAGFLFAGSSSVVSSLWTVSDLSTSFLMMKFYEIILDKNQNISIPVALKMAQDWLRNLTVKEYINTLNNCNDLVKQNQQKSTEKELSRLTDLIEDEQYRIKRFEPNYQLFNKPFYWAAFTASGI